MSNYGILSGLMGAGHGKIMGLDAAVHQNPATGDYDVCLTGPTRRTIFRIDRYDITRAPAKVEAEIIKYAIQLNQMEQQHGLPRQGNQTASSGPTCAFSGGGGGGGGAYNSSQQLAQQNHPPVSLYGFGAGGVGGTAKSAPYTPPPFSGFKLGELTGVRGWNIGSDGFLRSMTADVVWAPGEPMDGKTKAGEEHNGVYAYKKARDFLKSHGDLHIYGKVHLWGDVIEHELGYRAEYAKIISLDGVLGKTLPDALRYARERYKLAA